MRASQGLIAAAITALTLALVPAAASASGLNTGLCQSTPSRVSIPSNFAVDACFDGSHLVIENTTSLVLDADQSGSVGNPKREETDDGLAAVATRAYTNGDPHIFLPGDKLTFPVGSGSGALTLYKASPDDNSFDALATTIAAFIPFKSTGIVSAFTGLVTELNSDFVQYQECMTGKNWLGQAGCKVLLARNVAFAGGRATLSGFGSVAIADVLSAATWSKWFDAQVDDLQAVVKHTYTNVINVPALASTSSPASSTSHVASAPAAPSTASPASPTSLPAGEFVVQNATGGIYWRSSPTWSSPEAVSGTGFYPGTVIRVSCYQAGAANVPESTDGMWEQAVWASGPGRGSGWVNEHFTNDGSAINTPSPGIGPCQSSSPTAPPAATTTAAPAAPVSATTTSASTNASSPGATAFPPPASASASTSTPAPAPAPTTWSETVGSDAHTWSDPANAGGNEGPTIPGGQTVQIACRLQGFTVADGDTWWYQIASAPWNDAFYVSADAFYNNGQTSGTLKGTPFVDPAVNGC
jgi:hypothetical protein